MAKPNYSYAKRQRAIPADLFPINQQREHCGENGEKRKNGGRIESAGGLQAFEQAPEENNPWHA